MIFEVSKGGCKGSSHGDAFTFQHQQDWRSFRKQTRRWCPSIRAVLFGFTQNPVTGLNDFLSRIEFSINQEIFQKTIKSISRDKRTGWALAAEVVDSIRLSWRSSEVGKIGKSFSV